MIVQGFYDSFRQGSETYAQTLNDDNEEATSTTNDVESVTVPSSHMGGLLRLDKNDASYQASLPLLQKYLTATNTPPS